MIVGIDLGTTNSAVGIWRDGHAMLIPNALGDLLTPSAVSVVEDCSIFVGLAAGDRQSTHPKLTATSFKRLIGTEKTAKLGRAEYSAEELSALVLRSLVADAEAFTGERVTGAVITVLAYFYDRQRKATGRAGELAGFVTHEFVACTCPIWISICLDCSRVTPYQSQTLIKQSGWARDSQD